MFGSPDAFLAAHMQWVYGAMFLLSSALAGPSAAMVCGAFATAHHLNPLATILSVALGDSVNDAAFYVSGRFPHVVARLMRFSGRFVPTLFQGKPRTKPSGYISRYVGYSARLLDRQQRAVREWFLEKPLRRLLSVKLMYGVGFVGLIAAGNAGIPYLLYATICAPISLAQTFVFIEIGAWAGNGFVMRLGFLGMSAVTITAVILLNLLLRASTRIWLAYRNS